MANKGNPLPRLAAALVKVTERQFYATVDDTLRAYYWEFDHVIDTYPHAKRTSKGYPDYICFRMGRIVFLEIKSEGAKLSPEQEYWRDLLKMFDQVEWYLIRPSDYEKLRGILQ